MVNFDLRKAVEDYLVAFLISAADQIDSSVVVALFEIAFLSEGRIVYILYDVYDVLSTDSSESFRIEYFCLLSSCLLSQVDYFIRNLRLIVFLFHPNTSSAALSNISFILFASVSIL